VVARPKTIYSNKKFAHAYPVGQGRHGRKYKILGNNFVVPKKRASAPTVRGRGEVGRWGGSVRWALIYYSATRQARKIKKRAPDDGDAAIGRTVGI